MTTEMITMIRLGRDVVSDGRLRALRDKLKMSRNVMSELFHVSPITYARWENDNGENLRALAAEKIGRFYQQTTAMVEQLEADGTQVSDLIPFHLAAAAAGIPNEMLLNRYRSGDFEAVDLGILGLWLHRTDLHRLGIDDQ